MPNWQKCPRCDGQGHTARPPWVPGDQPTWDTATAGSHPCPPCNGTGLIALTADGGLITNHPFQRAGDGRCGFTYGTGADRERCGNGPKHHATVGGDESVSPTEAARRRVMDALLLEYPWHDHDCWTTDDENRAMHQRGDNPWPHLTHVAEVAVGAALAAQDDPTAEHRIKLLAKALGDLLVALGAVIDAPMTGPQLLMLAEEATIHASEQGARLAEAEALLRRDHNAINRGGFVPTCDVCVFLAAGGDGCPHDWTVGVCSLCGLAAYETAGGDPDA